MQGGLQMQPNEKNDLIYDQVHISFTIIIALNWIIHLPVNMATKQKKTPVAWELYVLNKPHFLLKLFNGKELFRVLIRLELWLCKEILSFIYLQKWAF